ncbi:MAG TPA: MFS transporter [Planctomycetota bacterium]|nr:MFS transporter [Planctomycetota bacterium]
MSAPASARGRRLVFAGLYFAEGAPIGFVWWTLPVVLTRAGVSPEAIGALLGWVVLPWGLKFLWAPLVDVLRGPAFGLRDWIAAAQVAMCATLLPLAWIDPLAEPGWLVGLLVAHALAAATQDVAVDTLAIHSTSSEGRGALNGWMQVGMLLGRGLFGGAALAWRERVGDTNLVLALVGVLVAALALRPWLPPEPPPRTGDALGEFRAHLGLALQRRTTGVLLAFAAAGATAFETVGAFAGPFLAARGASDGTIGGFLALPAVLGLGAGALLGGWWSDRVGRRPVLVGSSLAVSAAALAFAWLPAGPAAWAALAGVYLGAGVLTAASYALFMDRTDPSLGATQFSAAMGATNLCEAWSARLGGRLAASHGYPVAFTAAALLGLAALPLLVLSGRADARGDDPR